MVLHYRTDSPIPKVTTLVYSIVSQLGFSTFFFEEIFIYKIFLTNRSLLFPGAINGSKGGYIARHLLCFIRFTM